DRGEDSRRAEEQECGDDEALADPLVIVGLEPADDAALVLPRALERERGLRSEAGAVEHFLAASDHRIGLLAQRVLRTAREPEDAPQRAGAGVHWSEPREALIAASSSGGRFSGGMLAPGLNCCGSRIHAARRAAVFSSVPAPIVMRPATCVRFGACCPCAGVPSIAWHIAQLRRKKRSRPRCSSALAGGRAGARCRCAHCA